MHELKRQKTENRRQEGLSIIEVVMASVLLIVAMVPILRSLTKAHMYSAQVETKTQSLILAQGKLDELKATSVYDFNSIVSASDVTFPETSYLCDIDVSDTSSNLKQVTVSVGPSDGGIEAALATYFARRQ